MAGQVAQLAGFIDQAGLFRTLIAVANKLHSSFLPWKGWFCLGRLLEQAAGKFNRPKAYCMAPPHPEEPAFAGVSKDEARAGASWFETRQVALLTMRD